MRPGRTVWIGAISVAIALAFAGFQIHSINRQSQAPRKLKYTTGAEYGLTPDEVEKWRKLRKGPIFDQKVRDEWERLMILGIKADRSTSTPQP